MKMYEIKCDMDKSIIDFPGKCWLYSFVDKKWNECIQDIVYKDYTSIINLPSNITNVLQNAMNDWIEELPPYCYVLTEIKSNSLNINVVLSSVRSSKVEDEQLINWLS